MIHEKEIPEYALQVARAPQIIPCPAVYHSEKILSPGKRQTCLYSFEEDVLVPDIKEDMAEILLMEGNCDILPTAKKLHPKVDDLLNFTGNITLQTLYRPEREGCSPVAITSKVPYKYQWNPDCLHPAEGFFWCDVKSLEYMIINERKFRVRITLEFTSQIFEEKELSLFQNLEEEELEMKKQIVPFCVLDAVKREEVSLDAWLEGKEVKELPTEILQQNYYITENYRQVTTEKIVINGFVIVELLYRGACEEESEKLCHRRSKIEFTQFIPLEKEYRNKKWSFVKTDFRDLGLSTHLEKDEDGKVGFHVEGKIETCIFLYESQEREVVVDAYHLEKSFTCKFKEEKQRTLRLSVSSEIPVRELVHLPEGQRAQDAICCQCYLMDSTVQVEKGRVVVLGSLCGNYLWRHESEYRVTKCNHELRLPVEMENLESDMEADVRVLVRDCCINFLNERQLEFTCSLTVCCDGYKEESYSLLEEPAFVEGVMQTKPAMVITALAKDEDLWELAKRHKTTEKTICQINHIDQTPLPGQKILIVK